LFFVEMARAGSGSSAECRLHNAESPPGPFNFAVVI
jgi:hypothetical protein